MNQKTRGAIQIDIFDWNPQGARRRDGPRTTWRRIIEEEDQKSDKIWKEGQGKLLGGK